MKKSMKTIWIITLILTIIFATLGFVFAPILCSSTSSCGALSLMGVGFLLLAVLTFILLIVETAYVIVKKITRKTGEKK